jgi:hypothetical protein
MRARGLDAADSRRIQVRASQDKPPEQDCKTRTARRIVAQPSMAICATFRDTMQQAESDGERQARIGS